MTAVNVVNELARRGIRLAARGDRLRFFPRSAATPELQRQLKQHKPELLELLAVETDVVSPEYCPNCRSVRIAEGVTNRFCIV